MRCPTAYSASVDRRSSSLRRLLGLCRLAAIIPYLQRREIAPRSRAGPVSQPALVELLQRERERVLDFGPTQPDDLLDQQRALLRRRRVVDGEAMIERLDAGVRRRAARDPIPRALRELPPLSRPGTCAGARAA